MMIRVIGWTLVHALWQGGMLSLLLGAVLALAPRASATVRYRLAAATLALALALPVATAIITTRTLDNVATMQQVDLAGATSVSPSSSPGSSSNTTSSDASPIVEVVLRPLDGTQSRARRWLDRIVEPHFGWIVIVWLVGVTLRSVRAFGGWLQAHRLARKGTSPAPNAAVVAARRIEAALAITHPTRVVESSRIGVPFVVGVLRPIIVLPASLVTSFPAAQLELILAHELAHVARRDVLANLLQMAVETLLFYHPAIWWISARMRDEREHSCDELAIGACGGDRVAYTEALLALEVQRDDAPRLALAATGGSLLRRAARLLTGAPAYSDLGARWAASVLTAAFVVAASGPAVEAAAQAVPAPRIVAIDSARARPRFVLTSNQSTSLRDRWVWADSAMRTRGARSYWIGYRVSRTGRDNEWYYLDQRTPVAIGPSSPSWSNYSTRVRFDGGDDLSGVRIVGVDLTSLLGAQPASDVVVLLGFTHEGRGQRRWVRSHIANFVFPMFFDDWPVAWLGSPNEDESIAELERLITSDAQPRLRVDLVSAIGLHANERVAAPALVRLLNEQRLGEQLRAESADWLGHQPTREAISALAATSRRDESASLRKRAIFAFAHMKTDVASDTLRVFAERLSERDAKLAAIDALGHRLDAETVTFLANRARARKATRGCAMRTSMRWRTWSGTLGCPRWSPWRNRATMSRCNARRSTRWVAWTTRTPSPRCCVSPNRTRTPPCVQLEAAKALGESHPHDRAIAALLQLGRTHRLPNVRLAAVDGLATFDDEPAATAALRELSRSAPDAATRARAADLLRER